MRRKRVKIVGVGRIRSNLRKLAWKKQAALHPCMVDIVSFVQRESMERTPVRTGDLMGSHRSYVRRMGNNILGIVQATKGYALFVHEAPPSTNFQSPWPRGRKFMERAINENRQGIWRRIKRWMKL